MIRRIAIFGLGLAMLAGSLRAFAADEPAAPALESFTSKDGRFTINFPGTPKEESEDTDTIVGKVAMHTFTVEPKQSDEVYMVMYSDIPEKYVKEFDYEKALDGARDGVVKGINGKLLKEEKIKVGDVNARDLTIELSDAAKSTFRWRFFYTGARQYQLVVGATGHQISEERAKPFFESFKLDTPAEPKP